MPGRGASNVMPDGVARTADEARRMQDGRVLKTSSSRMLGSFSPDEDLINARMSGLITSAWVVIMPCGKPL